MVRSDILAEAERLVSGDRHKAYGDAKASFERIAALWSAYLGVPLSAVDVGALMILLKVSRSKTNPDKRDNWVDICGYGALAGEIGETK